MLTEYPLSHAYIEKLCKIFHKSLTTNELMTKRAELVVGKFMIKQLASISSSYGVWYDDNFLFIVNDLPPHSFSVSVRDDNFLTENMVIITLDCLIKAHKASKKIKFKTSDNQSIELIRAVIAENSDHFSNEEIVDMSELLYGEGNQKQFESRD